MIFRRVIMIMEEERKRNKWGKTEEADAGEYQTKSTRREVGILRACSLSWSDVMGWNRGKA